MADEVARATTPDGPADDPVEALARRAAHGDAPALRELLGVIRPVVRRRCQRVLADPAEVEEACDDTLVAVEREIASIPSRARVGAWLSMVASRAAIDTHRRARRRAARSHAAAGSRIELLDALVMLPATASAPLAMRDFQGLSYDDIAAVLDVAVDAVKERLLDARRQLRDVMTARP